jgi:hypothetical protein
MPTPKQMRSWPLRLPSEETCRRREHRVPATNLPREYWQALLHDAAADREPPGPSIRMERLADIQRHLLRVACRRCGRTLEIQNADAVRLARSQAVWKDVGQRLLDDTCTQRTERHEEDGCWPVFE